MDTITFENNAFIYNGKGSKTVLLNCADFLSNKSRLPMHSYVDDLTVPELILGLIDENEQLALSNALLDILVASDLVKTAFPVKVLEVGAVIGTISYHLATLLGKFHPESQLCCVSDSIGNGSENQWLDRIVLVEEPPRISFLAGDYDGTSLQKSGFDLIVINGTVNYEDPYGVICEAERLIKNKGTIICYSVDSPLLESSFKTIFPQITEYPLPGYVNVMVTQPSKVLEKGTTLNQMEKIYDYIKEVKQLISECKEIEIKVSLKKIQEYLEAVLKVRDTDAKIQLIDLRDSLLDYLVFCSDGKGSELTVK